MYKRQVHSTDPSNASRTMLFDLHTQDWNDEILALLNIPRSVLPSIAPSSAVVGESLPEWLGGSIPIAGVAGDQQAATFGPVSYTHLDVYKRQAIGHGERFRH